MYEAVYSTNKVSKNGTYGIQKLYYYSDLLMTAGCKSLLTELAINYKPQKLGIVFFSENQESRHSVTRKKKANTIISIWATLGPWRDSILGKNVLLDFIRIFA